MGWDLPSLALLALFVLLLIAAGVEDVRHREIANWKNALLALSAPLWWWAIGLAPWPDMVLQVSLALIVFALFCGLFAAGWMGGGDVKLIGAVALWLPAAAVAQMLVAMSLAGGVLTLLLLAERAWRGRKEAVEVPYGVAIAFAGLLAVREPVLNHFG